ncbi:MAG TPA: MBL fold metallo-hydrolase [Bacteroidales bacterium]|nr:MBL fold metallo-hydrolase [Bacteroidales bacterium]
MEVIFLGTGTSQGIPVIGCNCKVCCSKDDKDKRLRSSLFIKSNNTNILIDAGPDFRQQMLRENINKLDAVVFTHEHIDHIAGLDDIRAFNHISDSPMEVYAEKRVLNALKKTFSYIFDNSHYPGIPHLNLNVIGEDKFKIHEVEIEPIRVLHYNLPILGFKINELAYITDANFISKEQLLKLKSLKVLIINALRIRKHVSHFSLSEAIEIIKICNPDMAYLTHISHQLGLHEEVNQFLSENIRLTFDQHKIYL